MRPILLLLCLPLAARSASVDVNRFAELALGCIHREYPNKIAHTLNSDADVRPPRELTPAFYGCYDWHSAVHGHWLLARLVRARPDAPFVARATSALAKSLTAANIAREVEYLKGEGRAGFERPYGLAWLLQLGAELREWDAPEARQWSAALRPLERAAVVRLTAWLPKLTHPVRSGEHSQTAFALGLMLDWARSARDRDFEQLVQTLMRRFYLADRGCPLSYEPSGEDFLSPCLAEADALRRILPPAEFAKWLRGFLPAFHLEPAAVSDPADPKLVHLAGLNLSRAWMFEGIVGALPRGDPRIAPWRAAVASHRDAGLAAISAAHYEGGHWLGTFAVYLLTKNGLKTK